jgi:hypothetical protein
MKKQLAGISAAVLTLAAPAITFAQNPELQPGNIEAFRNLLTPIIPTGTNINIATTATAILQFLILIAGIIAIFYLIWAGIQYITAGGDDDKAKKARAGIFNAVIGIVVIIFAYAIIVYVASLARNANAQLLNGQGGFGTTNTATDPYLQFFRP